MTSVLVCDDLMKHQRLQFVLCPNCGRFARLVFGVQSDSKVVDVAGFDRAVELQSHILELTCLVLGYRNVCLHHRQTCLEIAWHHGLHHFAVEVERAHLEM